MNRPSIRLPSATSLFVVLTLLGIASRVEGAACCGSTANVPSLISGDDRSQLSLTLSNAGVIADAPVVGGSVNRPPNDNESLQTFRIDGATLLSDRWQAGFTVPVVRRSRTIGDQSSSSSGLGDLAGSVGYEFLPDWDYAPLRPKGIVFLQGIVPTGTSMYDSTQAWALDSRGRGFFAVSGGILLVKSWGDWDASLLIEGHRSFSKTVSTQVGPLVYTPGFGGSAVLGVGVSPFAGAFRFGGSLFPTFEQSVVTSGTIDSTAAPQQVWTGALQASYMINDDLSASLTYSDQTIFAFSSNTPLSRSVAFLIQKRWGR